MAVYFCEQCKTNHVLGRHCPKDEPLTVEDEMIFGDIKEMYSSNLFNGSWKLYRNGLIVIAVILSAIIAGFYFFG